MSSAHLKSNMLHQMEDLTRASHSHHSGNQVKVHFRICSLRLRLSLIRGDETAATVKKKILVIVLI